MVVFPNCKINLGLHILRKRADGFHDIETAFHPVPCYDVLEIIQKDTQRYQDSTTEFTTTGLSIGSSKNNLCLEAIDLIRKDFPNLPPLLIHLHKAIPVGAGLGGGSADAAFTLSLINSKFNLGLTEDLLLAYALQLGSDCPFFIINQTCLAGGRGEILEPFNLDLHSYKIIVVNPGIHVNTAGAFAGVTPAPPKKTLRQVLTQPIDTWKHELKNDFEQSIFQQYPEIAVVKDELYRQGAVYASMSGSGSSVYGIFRKEEKIENTFPATYFFKD